MGWLKSYDSMMKESLLTLHQLIELIFSTQSMKSLDATNHGHHWPGDSFFSLRHALGGDMGHVPRRGYVCSTNLFETLWNFWCFFFSTPAAVDKCPKTSAGGRGFDHLKEVLLDYINQLVVSTDLLEKYIYIFLQMWIYETWNPQQNYRPKRKLSAKGRS